MTPSSKRRAATCTAAVAALILFADLPARADDHGKAPSLNGHTFTFSPSVSQPFTVTNLGTTLLIGLGSTTGTLTINGNAVPTSFDYAGMGGRIAYEYAFGGRFSVRGEFDDFVYSGINGRSALAVGTTLLAGGGLGFTANWDLGEATKLGLLLDVSYQPNLILTILGGINSIVNSCNSPSGCNVEPGTLFSSTGVFKLQPAMAVSYAPSASVGLTGAVTYFHAWYSGTQEGSADGLSLAGAVDYDFKPGTSVPIGLQASANWTTPIGSSNLQHTTDLGAGILYTGRSDLSTGVLFIVRRFAVRPELDVTWSTAIVQMGLRYYF